MRDYCPICGQEVGEMNKGNPSPKYFEHRCKESVLRALNAAQTRGLEDISIADLRENVFGVAIEEGFRLNNMSQEYDVS